MSYIYRAIIVYILVILLVLISKPSFVYCDKKNTFKDFGLKEGQSIIALPMIMVIIPIVCYFSFFIMSSQ